MEFGRIQSVLVATSVGDIVYERFYDKFSDLEKADIRAAFYSTTEPYLQSLADGAEYAARFKQVLQLLMELELDLQHAPDAHCPQVCSSGGPNRG